MLAILKNILLQNILTNEESVQILNILKSGGP